MSGGALLQPGRFGPAASNRQRRGEGRGESHARRDQHDQPESIEQRFLRHAVNRRGGRTARRWSGDQPTPQGFDGMPDLCGRHHEIQMTVEGSIEDRNGNGAEQGNGQEARDGGDGIVDAGGHARLMRRDGVQDRRRQRRDGHRHAESDDQHGQEEGGPIGTPHAGQGQKQQAQGRDGGAADQRPARTEAVQQPARPARQQAEDEGEGEKGGACSRRRIAVQLDEGEGQKEEGTAEGAVEQQGQEIDPAEHRRAEQPRRHHGVWTPPLLPQEARQKDAPRASDARHETVRPAAVGGSDQAIGEAGESAEGQQRALPVETPAVPSHRGFRECAESRSRASAAPGSD